MEEPGDCDQGSSLETAHGRHTVCVHWTTHGSSSGRHLLLYVCVYFFIWLHQALVGAHRLSSVVPGPQSVQAQWLRVCVSVCLCVYLFIWLHRALVGAPGSLVWFLGPRVCRLSSCVCVSVCVFIWLHQALVGTRRLSSVVPGPQSALTQ